MSKKTENIGFRQTPEEKAQLIKIAKEMEMSPGSRLVWPPEFNYYPKNSSKQDMLLAAEKTQIKYKAKKNS